MTALTTGTARALLDAAHPDLRAHHDALGPLPTGAHDEVAAAGLTGRGGGGFPVARKIAAVVAASAAAGRAPVVVANGAEGEPASRKDRALMRAAPHLVLDGLQVAAEATGATKAYAYVTVEAEQAVRAALAQRTGVDRIPVDLRTVAADHFVGGEESAVVAALEGGRALPRDKARRIVEAGVRGRPTLVQNVETLAHLALIARNGAAWFRGHGTAAEPGTLLVTVSGAVARPGVLEVEHGTPLREVLAAAGATQPAPVLVGGFHGAWLAPDEVAVADLSRASLATWDATPGAGVLVVLPPGGSLLDETARIVDLLADRSARQCVACINGLPRMGGVLRALAEGTRVPEAVAEGHRLAALVRGRGACHHPDGVARLFRSALRLTTGASS